METKIVFNTCMKFRQGIAKEADSNNEYPVLKNVTEAELPRKLTAIKYPVLKNVTEAAEDSLP